MRILKKINKGVIATFIVVFILTMHLMSIEMDRKQQKGKIETACRSYLQTIDTIMTIPEADRKDIDGYIEKVKTTIQPHLVDKKEVLDLQMKWITQALEQEKETEQFIKSQESEIVKMARYQFDNDQVTVSITGKQSKEIESAQTQEIHTSKSDTSDEIVLKKEGDTWKIVYANLSDVTMALQATHLEINY